MRKFTALFIVLVMLSVAIVPGFAQDEESTIADIVVASAGAEEAEFTVLLAAVQAADPIFLELLADEESSLTVFAPTDAAFVDLLEALGLTAEEVLADTDLLNSVLAYHVVPGAFDAEAVVALDGALLGTVLGGTALAISVDDGVFVNESEVIIADVAASNGIVHVIDAVLVPEMADEMDDMDDEMMMEPEFNIAEIVIASAEAEEPEFTILLAAVQAADPAILATLTGPGPYTVFAPTDAAFAAALDALGLTAEELLGDTELLTSVLAYHVAPGEFYSDVVVEVAAMDDDGVMLATALAGTAVTISLSDMGVMVDDATVIGVDVAATNGVIHVIDSVILPPME